MKIRLLVVFNSNIGEFVGVDGKITCFGFITFFVKFKTKIKKIKIKKKKKTKKKKKKKKNKKIKKKII